MLADALAMTAHSRISPMLDIAQSFMHGSVTANREKPARE